MALGLDSLSLYFLKYADIYCGYQQPEKGWRVTGDFSKLLGLYPFSLIDTKTSVGRDFQLKTQIAASS